MSRSSVGLVLVALVVGGVIVRIDGAEFETFSVAERASYAKRTGVCRLAVLRSGRVREIVADLRPMADDQERPGATPRAGLRGE